MAGRPNSRCLLSDICPAHNNGTCFQCVQVMQYSSLAVIVFDHELSSVNYPSAQVSFLSWISAIDPDPPRTNFSY